MRGAVKRSAALFEPLWRRGLYLAVVVVVWAAAVRLSGVEPFLFPGPLEVGRALIARGDFLLFHAAITLSETLLGLVAGTAIGIVAALAMARFDLLRRMALPLVVASQALPVFAIAPLLVLWFGYGLASKVVMAGLIIFFPVASAFLDGLTRTDPDLIDLGRLLGARRTQLLMLIRLPAAVPSLASGVRVAATLAPLGAVVGEWVGSAAGLGFVMLQANARLQTDTMFAALALLATMTLILRAGVDYAMRRLVSWV